MFPFSRAPRLPLLCSTLFLVAGAWLATPSAASPAAKKRTVRAPAADTAPVVKPVRTRRTPAEAAQGSVAFEAGEYLELVDGGQSEKLLGLPAAAPVPDGGYDAEWGRLAISYEAGDASQRLAHITTDPLDASNHVLGFVLSAANVPDENGAPLKGRVQLSAYDAELLRAAEVRFRTRMFLSPDLAKLRDYPAKFEWLTLSEWWNNAGWTGEPYPFRVAVNVAKTSATVGAPLYFSVKAQTLDVATNTWNQTIWSSTNQRVEVPLGRWVTLEYAYLQGDSKSGRFYLAMTPDGGSRRVIFDMRGWTQHPKDPKPDGLTHFNPVKIYTSAALIDHMRSRGVSIKAFWDEFDLRLCRTRGDEATSPCAPASFE